MIYEKDLGTYTLVSATDKLGVPYMDWRKDKYLYKQGRLYCYGSRQEENKKLFYFNTKDHCNYFGFRTSFGAVEETETEIKLTTENSIYIFRKD